MANNYEVPSWAGKPPTGLHLDVLKDDKLIQKLMIDEKKCYLFGRNSQMNDFCIDHASCSRVHSALVYHKNLNICYLVDLGSTHGTFIGTLRLEHHKPTQLQMNSTFHFGASTRKYVLRERPSAGLRVNIMEDLPLSESAEGALLGLPESQTELDNLTEYNTAHNRRISMLGITDDTMRKNNKNRKRRNVTFNDEEIVINPEDIDPNVGRFRNLIQTTVIPTKRQKLELTMGIPTTSNSNVGPDMKHMHPSTIVPHLYQGLPAAEHGSAGSKSHASSSLSPDVDVTSPLALGTKLGLLMPNPAPEVTPINDTVSGPNMGFATTSKATRYEDHTMIENTTGEPQKKKYAKEAWPGRKPMLGV